MEVEIAKTFITVCVTLMSVKDGDFMIIEYEKSFLSKFIKKNKRPRLEYELLNLKKRKNAIGRFCHTSKDYVEVSKIIYEGNKITISSLNNLIKKYTQEKNCYLISWYTEIDGILIDLNKALEITIGAGMPSILIFKNLVVIETEQEQGAAIKYVLFSKE